MLILTRKAGESLYIGDGIKLTVLGIQGKQIKLGLTLPDSMTVYREEIYDLIAGDNALAKKSKKDKLNHNNAPKTYEINTRLGIQEIAENKIIHFPKGLIGYEDELSFALLELAEDSPFSILQSTKTPDLGFIVTDPYIFLDAYSVKINDVEQVTLHATHADNLFVYVTVTIPHGKADQTTLNLAGPVFINHEKRLGMQIPQDISTSKVLIAECGNSFKGNDEACAKANDEISE